MDPALAIHTRNSHVRSTSGEMLQRGIPQYNMARGSTSMSNLRDNNGFPLQQPLLIPGNGPSRPPMSIINGPQQQSSSSKQQPHRALMPRFVPNQGPIPGPIPPPGLNLGHGPIGPDGMYRVRPTAYSNSGLSSPGLTSPLATEIPWRPQPNVPNVPTMERPEINVEELAGKQMLPLEPRPILEQAVDDTTMTPMSRFLNIMEILRFRGLYQSNTKAFSVVDIKGRETASWTWEKLHGKAEKISQTIIEKTQLRRGSRVALVFRKSEILEFLAAFIGCMMAGMTAVPINVIEEFAEMTYILSYTKAELALTTEYNHRALHKDLSMHKGIDWPMGVQWWKTDTFSNWNPKKKDGWPDIDIPDLAYIEYSKSPNGELKGVAISHRTILSQCHAIKQSLGSNNDAPHSPTSPSPFTTSPSPLTTSRSNTNSSEPGTPATPTTPPSHSRRSSNVFPDGKKSDIVLSWLEPRQQVGLVLGGLLGVYRGSHTVFIHSGVTDTPGLWAHCANRYRATMALGDYEGVRELMRYRPTDGMRRDSPNLSCLRLFMIDTVIVKPMLNLQFANEFLTDMGVPNPHNVVVPMSSLPEHGGMIMSMRDELMFPRGADVIDFGFEYEPPRGPLPEPGTKARPIGHSPASNTICHYLLDRGALKGNLIQVLATGEEALARATERGVVLVGAFGYAMSRATLAIVDPETTALCQPNRVGEIWVDSPSIAFGFWELPKHSQSIFHALPLIVPIDTMIPEVYDPVPAGFLRTGLLGGLIEGRVVVFGLYEDRIQQEIVDVNHPEIVEFDYHYTADLSNTILDRIVGFSACISFECYINNEHLPVICAETPRHQRSDLVKLAEFAMQAMSDYHGLRLYCVAIAPTGSLPRAFKNGKRVLHPVLCRKMFELGRLRLMHIYTSVDDTIFNISYGDDTTGGIWGVEALAVREAALPSHARMVQFSCCDYPKEVLDEKSKVNLSQFPSLSDVLVWRSIANADDLAFVALDARGKESKGLTFKKFSMKVAGYTSYLEKRGGFKMGDKVVLLFPNGIEFAAAIHACWMLGLVPVPIQLPEAPRLHEDIVLLMGVLAELKVNHLIGNNATEELMKQKTTLIHIKACIGPRQDTILPTVFNITKAPKMNKMLGRESGYDSPPKQALSKAAPAAIFVHYSTDMRRTMVKVNHAMLMAQCRAQKVQCRLKTGRSIVSCWKTFSGLGLLQACCLGIYVGAGTIMMQHSDFMASPQVYFEALERQNVKDSLLNYPMLEHSLSSLDSAQSGGMHNLGSIKNLMISVEGRPRTELNQLIERRFATYRLENRFTSVMFGHMINPMVTTRSYMNIEPVRLHISLKSLRRGTIRVTTELEDPNGIWIEDSGIPICGTTVAIVNPETREICLSREIGEIWISSESNVQSFQGAGKANGGRSLSTPLSVEASAVVSNGSSITSELNGTRDSPPKSSPPGPPNGADVNSRYNVTIAGGDSRISYVRTGEIGFLWNYSNDSFNGGKPTSLLFVLGSIGETFEVNGLMHFPKDIEATIEKAHPNVAPNGGIVFQADEAVVCVVQVRQADAAVVNLTMSIMHQVLEKHQFIPDVIAIVGEGVLTKNRYGEKQRGKMLSLFMSAKMPLLYIHYPRGSLPKSIPEQQLPMGSSAGANFMNPRWSTISSSGMMSNGSSSTSPQGSPNSSSNGKVKNLGEKPSSVHSKRSNASMASMRSVRSFIGTMFDNLKGGGHGGVGPGSSKLNGSSLGLGMQTAGSASMSRLPPPSPPSPPRPTAAQAGGGAAGGGAGSPGNNGMPQMQKLQTMTPVTRTYSTPQPTTPTMVLPPVHGPSLSSLSGLPVLSPVLELPAMLGETPSLGASPVLDQVSTPPILKARPTEQLVMPPTPANSSAVVAAAPLVTSPESCTSATLSTSSDGSGSNTDGTATTPSTNMTANPTSSLTTSGGSTATLSGCSSTTMSTVTTPVATSPTVPALTVELSASPPALRARPSVKEQLKSPMADLVVTNTSDVKKQVVVVSETEPTAASLAVKERPAEEQKQGSPLMLSSTLQMLQVDDHDDEEDEDDERLNYKEEVESIALPSSPVALATRS